jgi:hypothetical protein
MSIPKSDNLAQDFAAVARQDRATIPNRKRACRAANFD